MDEVSRAPRWRWVGRAGTMAFAVLAVLSALFIAWRGFVAESSRPPTPLFGEKTTLDWEGRKCTFILERYADADTLRPGDLVIRAGEVGAKVWRVLECDPTRLRLARRTPSGRQVWEVAPRSKGAMPRFILLSPVP